MSTAILFTLIAPLILLTAVGAVTAKCGMAPEDFQKRISNLAVNVFMPASVIVSVQVEAEGNIPGLALRLIFLITASILVSGTAADRIAKRAGLPLSARNIYAFASGFGNYGVVGYSLVQATYGSEGILYLTIMTFASRILLYSYGPLLFRRGSDKGKSGLRPLRVLISPVMVSIYLGVILLISGITLPAVINQTFRYLSNCLTPVGMLLIGMSAAASDMKSAFKAKAIYFAGAARLIVVPLVFSTAAALCGLRGVALGTSAIAFALPAPALCHIFCQSYGGDLTLSSQVVLLTTLLCLLTVPVVLLFAEQVLPLIF